MSAERGMTEWTANGVDYTINDPNIAEEFDPTKAYHVRDHVYYQGNLYVFVAEHAAGAWNTSHVLLFKVGTELANLWNANETEATLRAAADNDLKSALTNLNASSNAENDFFGSCILNLNYYDGYWTNDNSNISKRLINPGQYLRSDPIIANTLFISIDSGYGLRVIVGRNGKFLRHTDYSPQEVYPYRFLEFNNDETLYFNFFDSTQTSITAEQAAEHIRIYAVSVDSLNIVFNSMKTPEGYSPIHSKIKFGGYYNNTGFVNSSGLFTSDLFYCGDLMTIDYFITETRRTDYIVNYYDENKTYLNSYSLYSQSGNNHLVFIVPKGAKYARIYDYIYNLGKSVICGKKVNYIDITDFTFTPNSYIDKDTGAVVSTQQTNYASSFIDVEGYDFVVMDSYRVNANVWYAFYDKNQTYVNGGLFLQGIEYIKIPAIVKYVRTSFYDERHDECFVRLVDFEDKTGPYFGKYFSILGDSISTFKDFIPSGNAYWYPHGDMTRVTDLWWSKLLDHFHGKLLIDEAWSGSQISGTDASAANNDSRCKNLGTETQDPDVIIVYMGTNDYDHNVALGTYDGHDTIPSTVATFSDAYAVTLDKILTKYKHAEVWCCTLQPMERHGQTGFPEKNNLGLTPEDYNEVIRKIAHAMNCKVLEHSQCGITYYNMPEYFEDWSGSKEHPNKAGHTLIARHDIRFML